MTSASRWRRRIPPITGTETITYTNNSLDYIPNLPIRLYMNVHQPEAQREENKTADFLTAGVTIDEFRLNGEVTPWAPVGGSGVTYKVIRLPLPLAPGESVVLGFDWHYDLATEYKHEGVYDPTTFFLGYFYPRVSPNNDTDIASRCPTLTRKSSPIARVASVSMTLPTSRFRSTCLGTPFCRVGHGVPENPDEVLQPEYAQRLEDSMTSDEVINIATPEEIQQGLVTTQADTVTWTWNADNVTEFGIGLSDHFVWDAGSVVVDPATGRRASAQAAYPVEAADYKTMVQDIKDTLVFGSTEWPGVPYPYDKATVFVGGADEEFPMIANDGAEAPPIPGATVRFVAAHEILHNYFPFYMGIDERRYPMLDEGWTTFFEYLFNLQDMDKQTADMLFAIARSSRLIDRKPGVDIPIITPADATRGPIAGNNAYEKPALALLALKEVMGDDAFKASLQEFIDRWNGKHPLPWDMFNTFNDTSEQDLTWFFQNWFFEPYYSDVAIENVEKGADGTVVTVKNVGGFAIPFDLLVTYADDTTETFHQNPVVWQDSPRSVTITVPGDKEVKSAQVNAGIFLEDSMANNAWPAVAVDPKAPVVAEGKNAEGTAAIYITLPHKTTFQSGQYNTPTGAIVLLLVEPPTTTVVEAIKATAAKVNTTVEDSQIVDGGTIAGHPAQLMQTTIELGGVAYGL
ncbi:MAG: M1 family peptidase [Anaerolineales bacterium]|nr:M1 family peptidase [Anaerolineales bacterium]